MRSVPVTPSGHPLGKRPAKTPKLRAATFDDYDQIARLETRYGLHPVSYSEWSHLWLGNPEYRGRAPDWCIGWVLEDTEGQIVATMGNIPLAYELDGKHILAASGRSWAAEPEYRSAALLLLDRVINQPAVDLYLNTTVTAESAGALPAFDCLRVPVGLWDESAFWITQHQGFIESMMTQKKHRLSKTLSYPLSAASFIKDRVIAKHLGEGDVEVKPCIRFDDQFDDFWEAVRTRQPKVLMAVRTREMLQWHFEHAILQQNLWVATVVDGRHLAAYAIFDRKDNAGLGLKRVRLVDYQSLDGSAALLPPMLSWALRKCRENGVHMLENVGRWLERGEVIDTLAPYRRKLTTWTYFYRGNNPELASKLQQRYTWAPSLFDGNASL